MSSVFCFLLRVPPWTRLPSTPHNKASRLEGALVGGTLSSRLVGVDFGTRRLLVVLVLGTFAKRYLIVTNRRLAGQHLQGKGTSRRRLGYSYRCY